jgi:hypothetical protein
LIEPPATITRSPSSVAGSSPCVFRGARLRMPGAQSGSRCDSACELYSLATGTCRASVTILIVNGSNLGAPIRAALEMRICSDELTSAASAVGSGVTGAFPAKRRVTGQQAVLVAPDQEDGFGRVSPSEVHSKVRARPFIGRQRNSQRLPTLQCASVHVIGSAQGPLCGGRARFDGRRTSGCEAFEIED